MRNSDNLCIHFSLLLNCFMKKNTNWSHYVQLLQSTDQRKPFRSSCGKLPHFKGFQWISEGSPVDNPVETVEKPHNPILFQFRNRRRCYTLYAVLLLYIQVLRLGNPRNCVSILCKLYAVVNKLQVYAYENDATHLTPHLALMRCCPRHEKSTLLPRVPMGKEKPHCSNWVTPQHIQQTLTAASVRT